MSSTQVVSCIQTRSCIETRFWRWYNGVCWLAVQDDDSLLDAVPPTLRDLVKQMLEFQPDRRPSIGVVKEHFASLARQDV